MRRIGLRYQLCAEIAAGGMASVHLARQLGDGGFARIVAVKRLHAGMAHDPSFVAMLLDEARLAARIRHPNVVPMLDVVAERRADGAGRELFLVMEYVHGASLGRLLPAAANSAAGAVPPAIATAILIDVLRGLHAAHEARGENGDALGVVHRDVSIHNVLVGGDGVSRLLDFGVAKASDRIATTATDQLKGKLTYMAPEQIRLEPIDRRADVYSASVVLWELLAGRKLFCGRNEAIIQHITAGKLAPPGTFKDGLPDALVAVVMRGLAHAPSSRFPTALAMAAALEQAITPATAPEVGAWVRALNGSELDARAQLIAAIEARASRERLNDAVESLRQLTTPMEPQTPLSLAPIQSTLAPPPARPAPPRRPRVFAAFAVGVMLLATLALAAFVIARRADFRRSLAAAPALAAASAPTPASAPPDAARGPAAPTCPPGMVLVPAGRFFMGSDDDQPAERPAHRVTLHAFCIDRTEVTVADYRHCSDRGDCKRAGTSNRWSGISAREQRSYDALCNAAGNAKDRGQHPINCVDWSMAERYCRSAGKRLPTEAEWEYAARGPDGRRYPWGDQSPTPAHANVCGSECASWLKRHAPGDVAWLYASDDGWPATAPVGSFPAGVSPFGAEDMVGNVWEWVADAYAPYTADVSDAVEPKGPDLPNGDRVLRGGAWNGSSQDWIRPTVRHRTAADTRSHGVGFRCAL